MASWTRPEASPPLEVWQELQASVQAWLQQVGLEGQMPAWLQRVWRPLVGLPWVSLARACLERQAGPEEQRL